MGKESCYVSNQIPIRCPFDVDFDTDEVACGILSVPHV